MTNKAIERWRQIESLFLAAHEKTIEERARFLDEACGSDQTLRQEVESLLVSESLAAGFLESDEPGVACPADPEPIPHGTQVGPYTVMEQLDRGGIGRF